MNQENDLARLSTLRTEVFHEPTTAEAKPALVEYVRIFIEQARALTPEQRLGTTGQNIAVGITGAIAFQGADGVDGDDWVRSDTEPVLFAILSAAGKLDASPDNQQAWDELFLAVQSL